MSFVKILMSVPDSAVTMNSAYLQLNTSANQVDVQGLQKLMADMVDGAQVAYTKISTGALQAASTGTFTGAATADQTMTIAGATFTAKASPDEAANEYLVSATVALEAASLARAINASSDLTDLVTASSALGVVTITAVQPGITGNQIPTVDINTSNFTFAHATLISGSDGTQVAINFGRAS